VQPQPKTRKIWCPGPKPEFELDEDVHDQWYIPARALLFLGPDDVFILPGGNAQTKEFVEFLIQKIGIKRHQIIWTSGRDYLLDDGIRKEIMPELKELVGNGDRWQIVPYSVTEPFLAWASELQKLGAEIIGDDPKWTATWSNKAILHRNAFTGNRVKDLPFIKEIDPSFPIPRGLAANTHHELMVAYGRLRQEGIERIILKPVVATTGEGIVKDVDKQFLKDYKFPMGPVILEEQLVLDIDPETGKEKNVSVQFWDGHVISLGEQIMSGVAHAGNQVPSTISDELKKKAIRITERFIQIAKPKGPGGIDFILSKGEIYFSDPNMGRMTGAHPIINFVKTYAPWAESYQGFKVKAEMDIWKFWQRLEEEGIAFKIGETGGRGVFPLCWLPNMWAMLVVVGFSLEETTELRRQAEACCLQAVTA